MPSELLSKTPHLFVAMSFRSDQEGIPSILCDDTLGIRLLVEHLRSLGHKRIALLRGNTIGESIQVAAWRLPWGDDYSPSGDSTEKAGRGVSGGTNGHSARSSCEGFEKQEFHCTDLPE